MPEGDTIHRAASRLAAVLTGAEIRRVGGSARAMQEHGRRLLGRRVEEVASRGKHLLVHLAGGWSVRTHLGMSGQWRVYRRGERWGKSAGKARVVLATDDWEAVCFSAPTVSVGPTAKVMEEVAHLGPDLLGEEFDEAEFLRRARLPGAGDTLGDLLSNQRVVAGVGNVYKSELLFMEGHHPLSSPAAVDDEALLRLGRLGRRLLRRNTTGPARITTAGGGGGGDLWVYGREGRPCRRCGAGIEADWMGDPPRLTYWCPACQVPAQTRAG